MASAAFESNPIGQQQQEDNDTMDTELISPAVIDYFNLQLKLWMEIVGQQGDIDIWSSFLSEGGGGIESEAASGVVPKVMWYRLPEEDCQSPSSSSSDPESSSSSSVEEDSIESDEFESSTDGELEQELESSSSPGSSSLYPLELDSYYSPPESMEMEEEFCATIPSTVFDLFNNNN